MLRILVATLLIAYSATYTGFGANKGDGNEILLTIDGRNITKDEFLRIYHKNNGVGDASNNKSVDAYMDLFINFKLKVIEAENLGMDTLQEFKQEYEGYVSQLANSYTYENAIIDSFARDAYEKKKTVTSVCDLLISVKEDAIPSDTLKAYNKIMSIRQRALNGESFEQLVLDYSEHPDLKTDSGFTRNVDFTKSPYIFENSIMSTPVGGITMPIRAARGYYLVKVESRIPSPGKIKVAHILIRTPIDFTTQQLDSAKNKIFDIYEQLKNGADFGEMAKLYSQDIQTAGRGGELSYFSMGKMIPEFEDAAFALQNNGDLSEPVRTVFGWHIIKRLDKQNMALYETMQDELIKQVKLNRKDQIEEAYINKLKTQSHAHVYVENLNELIAATDPGVYSGIWDPKKALNYTKPLFSYGDDTLTQYDLIVRLNKSGFAKNKVGISRSQIITNFLDLTIVELLKQYEIQELYENNPDFRNIVNEYHDGILLFNLTEKQVWSKAIQDTTGLEKYYENHSNSYRWKQRASASIYSFSDTLPLDEIRNAALLRIRDSISISDFINKFCGENNPNCISIKEGTFETGDEPSLDQFNWIIGITDNKIQNDTVSFAVIDKIISPVEKSFDEAKGNVIADYQNYLESEWIRQLRNKYPVTINQKVFQKIQKEESKK